MSINGRVSEPLYSFDAPRTGGKSVAPTRRELPPQGDVAPPAVEVHQASHSSAMSRYHTHDPYCAIHDEYGSCTCGAAYAMESLTPSLEAAPEASVDHRLKGDGFTPCETR